MSRVGVDFASPCDAFTPSCDAPCDAPRARLAVWNLCELSFRRSRTDNLPQQPQRIRSEAELADAWQQGSYAAQWLVDCCGHHLRVVFPGRRWGGPGPDFVGAVLAQVAVVSAADPLSGVAPGSFEVMGTSNEPDADRAPQVVITRSNAGDFVVQLEAGGGTGRVYTLTATASDLAGNTVSTTAICTVAHDQRK